MQAVVVHESMFGNTMKVAEAVASRLRERFDVSVVRAGEATAEMIARADLVIVGAPTHGHSLPKRDTRRSTLRMGVAAEVVEAPGVRELLETLRNGHGVPAAAFDTRLRYARWLTGAASKGIAKRLRRAGFTLVAAPESFTVKGTTGPLMDGELERAAAWGAEVARRATAGSAPRVAALTG